MKTIIGICGLKRAGKNTLAEGLAAHIAAEELGTSHIMSFADPLRSALYALDPYVTAFGSAFTAFPSLPAERLQPLIDDYGWEGVKDTPYGEEVRRLLQRFGTDSIRAIDTDFWVRAFLSAARDAAADFVIVPDVRFPNEADAVRGAGGAIVRVVRPGLQDDTDQHPSEIAMMHEPVDIEVVNDADSSALFEAAPRVITSILGGIAGARIRTASAPGRFTIDPHLFQDNETESSPS